MSHLHIPDGILPLALWLGGIVLTALLLIWSAAATRHSGPRELAFRSSLGGIMLAVMALPVPITLFDYCMTLAGPVGVLLGAGAAFQVSFVVTLILALLGQGGFTVVGLNALVLGLGAMAARPLYLAFVGALQPARAMAVATALSQLLSTVLWSLILVGSVWLAPQISTEHAVAESLVRVWHRTGAALVIPLLALAVALESLLGYGLGHFLARVRPDLLPVPARPRRAPDRSAAPPAASGH
jgi:cobalt/nickel transport system permease protein